MACDAALFAQVLDLLQRQGWASYRTLRRRFGLDEAALAVLTQALLDAQPVSVDDAGARLVWQGELRPAAAPTRTWDVVSSTPSVSGAAPWPLEGAQHGGVSPLVGREQEVALLQARWASVQAGQGQVVALSGEAGIGKSRLVQVVIAHVAGTPHVRWACHGAPAFQNSAFAPVMDLLQQVLHYQPDDPPAARLHKLETTLAPHPLSLPEVVPLLAALLAVPLGDRYPALTLTPERQKQRTLEAVWHLLRTLAAQQPVLLIVEDLHWIDPSTLELLHLLVEQTPTAPLYLLLTWRPEFQPPWSPPAHLTALTLGRLLPAQVEALARHVAGGKALPPVVLQQIVARTDGMPLFVEELTKMVLASGLLREETERYALAGPLPPLAIPSTLHDSLLARLEGLGAAQAVAQVGAVWGRGFTEGQLQAVAPLTRRQLAQALTQLVGADIVQEISLPPRVTYVFKHALIQEAAYASMAPDMRRQSHQRVAEVLVEQFSETVATQPELLAQHYTEAGLSAPAMPYWQRAGELAVRRSANLEAISHLTKGLELLQTLPDSPARDRQELGLQTTLGMALQTIKGYAAPEVDHAYARARLLCQRVGDPAQLVSVLRGQWLFYNVRADYSIALELGQQMLALAEGDHNPEHLVEAHLALGIISIYLGEFTASRTYLEQGIAIYNPQGQPLQTFHYIGHSRAMCLSYLAQTLWVLGYADQALQRSQEGLALAQMLSIPMTLAQAQGMHALLYLARGEIGLAQEWFDKTMAYATEHGFPYWVTLCSLLKDWLLAQQGQWDVGAAQFRRSLDGYRATGAKLGLSWFLALLADLYGKSGQIEDGLRVMAEALAHIENTGEVCYEAEVHRLKGELLFVQGGPDAAAAAEADFLRALEVARRQSATSGELHAATSLARLWRTQGRCGEARELLASVYGRFTEGFDTPDLQDARRLLEELGAVA